MRSRWPRPEGQHADAGEPLEKLAHLWPRAISGASECRSDQDEIAEIHRAVIATAWWLAAQVETQVEPPATPSVPPGSHIM